MMLFLPTQERLFHALKKLMGTSNNQPDNLIENSMLRLQAKELLRERLGGWRVKQNQNKICEEARYEMCQFIESS